MKLITDIDIKLNVGTSKEQKYISLKKGDIFEVECQQLFNFYLKSKYIRAIEEFIDANLISTNENSSEAKEEVKEEVKDFSALSIEEIKKILKEKNIAFGGNSSKETLLNKLK